ncbi:nucleotide exchange factor GrpE [Alphaproteobacteria bacterium]|nr:nucleotide exchange factor GrpE [Alphaproteobacteria bacterium]
MNKDDSRKFSKEKRDLKEETENSGNKDTNQTKTQVPNSEKKITDLLTKNKELEEKILRLLAESENLRKRHEREIQDSQSYAIKNFASSLLSIADNFQRALQSVPEKETHNTLVNNLIIGIKAVEKEFFEVFEKNGIKKFSSINQKFDPEIHQAVSKINHDKIQKGFVCDELQLGFKISDRLLRPAMVVVSEGPKQGEKKTKK